MGDEARADLEAAWPEDDDLTLSGVDENESEGIPEPSEGFDEPTDGQPDLEGSAGGGDDPEPVDELRGSEAPLGEGEVHAPEDVGSPVSWTAAAREQWKDIPKASQEYILRREQQMQHGMQKNAELANRAQAMDRSLAPYQQYFAMNGGQPGQQIQTLLQTAATLQSGAPTQRAEMVASLIHQFGVDIPSLDAILTGKQPDPNAPQQQNYEVQQQVAQAVAPYQQHMQQIQQQQQQEQQQIQSEAGGEVQQFAQDTRNEFYNDVRGDMADILDMASNRGVQLTMKQAYDRACMLNPEIGKILQSRTTQMQMQKRRKAASSVSGSLGGQGDAGPVGNMRGAIEDAWDNAGRA